MLSLDEVLTADAEPRQRRNYAADPLSILVDREVNADIRNCLKVLIDALTPVQREVLLQIGAGRTIRGIATELNREHSNVIKTRQSISRRLLSFADQNRIAELQTELSTGKKKGRRYRSLLKEYRRRVGVRDALKNLKELSAPIRENAPCQKRTPAPAFLFERLKQNDCRLPEYFKKAFGDSNTVCCLCRRCRAK